MDRKPPQKVRAIQGDYTADIITCAELMEVSKLQAAAWAAEQEAHQAVLAIEHRLIHGARIAPGNWFFDQDLRMVRTRRKKGSG